MAASYSDRDMKLFQTHFCSRSICFFIQEDDVIPNEPSVAKPFLPDDDEPQGGARAGPLPQKEEPRYIHAPGPQSQPPPPTNQVCHTLSLVLPQILDPIIIVVHVLQWNLHNTDTTGTLPSCPYYRGVLSSEVVQATPPQFARLTCITEILKATKEGPK